MFELKKTLRKLKDLPSIERIDALNKLLEEKRNKDEVSVILKSIKAAETEISEKRTREDKQWKAMGEVGRRGFFTEETPRGIEQVVVQGENLEAAVSSTTPNEEEKVKTYGGASGEYNTGYFKKSYERHGEERTKMYEERPKEQEDAKRHFESEEGRRKFRENIKKEEEKQYT